MQQSVKSSSLSVTLKLPLATRESARDNLDLPFVLQAGAVGALTDRERSRTFPQCRSSLQADIASGH